MSLHFQVTKSTLKLYPAGYLIPEPYINIFCHVLPKTIKKEVSLFLQRIKLWSRYMYIVHAYLLCKQLNKVLTFPELHLSDGVKCMREIIA